MSGAVTGESLRSELAPKIPREGCWIKHQSYSESDIPPILYGEQKDHNTPKKWAKYRAKKLEENYCGMKKTDVGVEAKAEENVVYVHRNTEQRIYHLVLKGEIQDSAGMRVSENQFYGEEPKYNIKYGKYHSGLVVKISGDYNPNLSTYHNQLAKITEVIDAFHYVVKTESRDRLRIRDTDVKSWLCTKSDDFDLLDEIKKRNILRRFD
jgi:hypothetical protein